MTLLCCRGVPHIDLSWHFPLVPYCSWRSPKPACSKCLRPRTRTGCKCHSGSTLEPPPRPGSHLYWSHADPGKKKKRSPWFIWQKIILPPALSKCWYKHVNEEVYKTDKERFTIVGYNWWTGASQHSCMISVLYDKLSNNHAKKWVSIHISILKLIPQQY